MCLRIETTIVLNNFLFFKMQKFSSNLEVFIFNVITADLTAVLNGLKNLKFKVEVDILNLISSYSVLAYFYRQ